MHPTNLDFPFVYRHLKHIRWVGGLKQKTDNVSIIIKNSIIFVPNSTITKKYNEKSNNRIDAADGDDGSGSREETVV